MTRDNLFELDVNYQDQKTLLKVRGQAKKVKKVMKQIGEEKTISQL